MKEKVISYSKGYSYILWLISFLTGAIIGATILKTLKFNPEYFYIIMLLPIISFVYLYVLYRSMPTTTFLKTITYLLIVICIIYIIFFFIGFVSCHGYNSRIVICSIMANSCDELPKQRKICDFIREDKSILQYIFGYYLYLSVFFISLVSILVIKINIKAKIIKNKFIYTKVTLLIIFTLIVILFPKIYNLITGADLFNI